MTEDERAQLDEAIRRHPAGTIGRGYSTDDPNDRNALIDWLDNLTHTLGFRLVKDNQ